MLKKKARVLFILSYSQGRFFTDLRYIKAYCRGALLEANHYL